MSTLYTENKDVRVSCSPFAIYPNEEIVSEIRKSEYKFSWIKSDEIKAIDVELIYAIYLLQYSTSRQLTQYLNLVRGIDIHQREITKLVTKYNKMLICSRFAFKSDLSTDETNLKAYTLAKNGNIILKNRPFNCNWKPTDSCILEDIKKYLARNQFIFKIIDELNISTVEWKSSTIGVAGSYLYNDVKYHIIPVRRELDFQGKLLFIINSLTKTSDYSNSDRIIIIGEDDKHLYEIFKHLAITKNMSDNILFTQDNRLLSLDIAEAFIKFNVYRADGKTKVELEQCNFI
ncbi:MAG: hypothetical protein RR620_12360 [Clostridium sp.]